MYVHHGIYIVLHRTTTVRDLPRRASQSVLPALVRQAWIPPGRTLRAVRPRRCKQAPCSTTDARRHYAERVLLYMSVPFLPSSTHLLRISARPPSSSLRASPVASEWTSPPAACRASFAECIRYPVCTLSAVLSRLTPHRAASHPRSPDSAPHPTTAVLTSSSIVQQAHNAEAAVPPPVCTNVSITFRTNEHIALTLTR